MSNNCTHVGGHALSLGKTDRADEASLAGKGGLIASAAMSKFIVGSFSMLMSPLLIDIGRSLSVGAEQLGLAGGAYGMASMVMAAAGARLQDRLPRQRLIIAGVSLHVLGLLATILAPAWQVLVGGHLVAGIGAGVLLPALVKLLADITPDQHRAAVLSRTNLGWGASSLLGLPLISAIASVAGWRAAPLALLALWTFVIGVLWRSLSTMPPAVLTAVSLGAGAPHSAGLATPPKLLALYGVTLLTFFGIFSVIPYLGSAVRLGQGVDATGAGILIAFHGAGFLAATSLGAWMDTLDRSRSLVASLLAIAALVAVLPAAIAIGPLATAIELFVWGAIQNVMFTSLTALVSMSPQAIRGRALALNQSALSAGAMIGTAAMGPLFAAWGFMPLALTGAAAIALAGVGMLWLWRRPTWANTLPPS